LASVAVLASGNAIWPSLRRIVNDHFAASASLTGQTFGGISIIGSSPIRTVQCKKDKPRHHFSEKKQQDFGRIHAGRD
jgi:hypothetical protein